MVINTINSVVYVRVVGVGLPLEQLLELGGRDAAGGGARADGGRARRHRRALRRRRACGRAMSGM